MDPHQSGHPFSNQFSHPEYLHQEPEPDNIEPFGAPTSTHTSAYTNGGAVDPIRRDGSAANPAFAIAPTRKPARYGPEGGLAPDGGYRAGNQFSDSSSNSIAASPSSGSSTFTYHPSGTVHHPTTLPTFANPVLPCPPVPGFSPFYRSSASIDSAPVGTLHLPHPSILRSEFTGTGYTGERDTPIFTRSYPIAGYPPYDTPRSGLASSTLYPGHSYGHPMDSSSQGSETDCSKFPWPKLEVPGELVCEGQSITPDIKAVVEKGFFQCKEEQKWTCYRRNYFSVNCSYTLTPTIPGARLYFKRGVNSSDLVKAIAVKISAAVDGTNGKVIELVGHTPKRDAGPKLKVRHVRILPQPSHARTDHQIQAMAYHHGPLLSYQQTGNVAAPFLSLQHIVEPEPVAESSAQGAQGGSQASPVPAYSGGQSQITSPGQASSHTYERIQFKCATANNGKRRASQQYFHLIVELIVDIRKDGATEANWQTIARRTSDKIVVRGRSPSHYQNEGAAGNNGRGNAGNRYNNGGAGGMPSGSMPYGNIGQGHMRSPGTGSSTGAGAHMGYPGMGYGSHLSFRPHSHYALPESSPAESGSSPESINADHFDADHTAATLMSNSDRGGIHDIEGYSYHPSPIYDPIHHHHLPTPKFEGSRGSTDPRQHAFKADFPEGTAGPQWQMHGPFGRYQAFDTSKNVFPDVSGGSGSYS